MLARSPRQTSQTPRIGNSTFSRKSTITVEKSQHPDRIVSLSDEAESQFSAPAETDDVEADEGKLDGSDNSTLAERLERNKKAIKTWMRTVPKSVAIIAARKQDIPDNAAGTVAATVSSFNTVAFDPDLYVSFNLKQNSSTLEVIVKTRYFAVTFPENNEYGTTLADRFAKGDRPPPSKDEEIAHYWSSSQNQKYFDALGLRYQPCVVLGSSNVFGPRTGFAFGMWYEYQSSVPVGDHVIVIAKALPLCQARNLPTWTMTAKPEDPFFTSRTTLGHVHGRYTTQDGIKLETLQLDDRSRLIPEHSDKKAFCASRLDIINQVLSKTNYVSNDEDKITYASFRHLLPEVQVRYQRYYMARLARLKSQEQPAPERLTDIVANLAPWEQLLVRQKRKLPGTLLEEEKQTCLRRLALLESKSYNFQQVSENDASDEELLKAVDDFPDNSATKRLEGLRRFWQNRLRIVCIVKLGRIIEDALEIEQNFEDIWEQIEKAKTPLIADRKEWSVEMLIHSRQQYDQVLSHIRRSLMRTWSGNQDKVNDRFIKDMTERYKHTLRSSVTLSWMIARRKHLDGDTDNEPLIPLIPRDLEIFTKTEDWLRQRASRDKVLQEASEQPHAPGDKEMSSEEFRSLLTGVMDSTKMQKQKVLHPKEESQNSWRK